MNSATGCLGSNSGGILGTAGLLAELSLPGVATEAAKSCITTMVMMHPMSDVISTKQAC